MTSHSTELFDYPLPEHLIAQTPASRRDESKLLVVDRATKTISHQTFVDLPRYLSAGDILFRNNARVIPARLHAQRPTGGKVECFLLHQAGEPNVWCCLVKPGKKLPIGATFEHPTHAFSGEILAKNENDGTVVVRFSTPGSESITAVANRIGAVPLPPYIRRETQADREIDLDRYQTVYADSGQAVAVAAPTAGLHFTPELLGKLKAQGVRTEEVTLHVGLGTFKPIATPTIEAHAIHRERYELPVASQRALFPPFSGRRIAVGTTSVRSIEDFLEHHAEPRPTHHVADTALFIHPPRIFRGVDALITNFHQPRSTLLCLVAAFLAPGSEEGIIWFKEIYREAVARNYRFLSYGDAMLIL